MIGCVNSFGQRQLGCGITQPSHCLFWHTFAFVIKYYWVLTSNQKLCFSIRSINKTHLLFSCQQNLRSNVKCHSVLSSNSRRKHGRSVWPWSRRATCRPSWTGSTPTTRSRSTSARRCTSSATMRAREDKWGGTDSALFITIRSTIEKYNQGYNDALHLSINSH